MPGMDETQYYIVNVEAAIVRNGRYLMIVRGEGESHAPGILSFPGGKVEAIDDMESPLEATAVREVLEEVGLEIHSEMEYLESSLFGVSGRLCVDVVFLCKYRGGEPLIGDPNEVASISWMTAQEVIKHEKSQPWTRRSIAKVEKRRVELRW